MTTACKINPPFPHKKLNCLPILPFNPPGKIDASSCRLLRAGYISIGGTGQHRWPRLSFMELPCPNIFAGEHAFHSKQEWISVQDMEKAVETLIHLVMIWEEQG